MYLYEDRLRAVELYIKLGKRVRLTIRQFGDPTKNALKGWYQVYARDAAMPAGYARQPRYSQVQRDLAVEHYQAHGRCLTATIRALGCPSRTVAADQKVSSRSRPFETTGLFEHRDGLLRLNEGAIRWVPPGQGALTCH